MILLCEGTLRMLPFVAPSYASAPFRQYDPLLGVSLIPGASTPHSRGCFSGYVSVNSLGMRDRKRSIENPDGALRIALMGDSVAEGVHVHPDEVVNIRMEHKLRERGFTNVEVLNFGIASIGTAQEYLLYKSRVSEFSPDIVILLFLPGNDVLNNSQVLQEEAYGIHRVYAPYFTIGRDSGLEMTPTAPRLLNSARTLLERNSRLLYYMERIWFRFKPGGRGWENLPIGYGVFDRTPSEEWEEAWQVTEEVLARFAEAVRHDGSEFFVMVLPSGFEIDPGFRKRLTDQYGMLPADLTPEIALERVERAGRSRGFDVVSLAPTMVSYRERYGLEWPYFSYTCDSHYSPLGHDVLAQAILMALEKSGVAL